MKIVPWPVLYICCWFWNLFQQSYSGLAFCFLYYSRFNIMHAAFGHFLHWFYPIYLLIAFALPKVKKEKTVETTADSGAIVKVSEKATEPLVEEPTPTTTVDNSSDNSTNKKTQ